jgi:hypothetical protein
MSLVDCSPENAMNNNFLSPSRFHIASVGASVCMTLFVTLVAGSLIAGCERAKPAAQPVPVAVDKAGADKPANAVKPASKVPSENEMARAGALHPDKPGGAADHPGKLPPGHPPVLPAGHPPIGGQGAGGQAVGGQVAAGQRVGGKRKGFVGTQIAEKVDAATGESAHAIAAVHAKKAELTGKVVKVRGKVVKFNAAIMNRNWLHIQDGTGSVDSGDHDLTVTTEAAAKVGDVVTIQGTLATAKDFGAGYLYDVIVENAKISQ